LCCEVESSGLGFPGVCLLLECEGLHCDVPFFCCWYQRFSGHRVPPLEARIQLVPDRSVAKLEEYRRVERRCAMRPMGE
jgi:hypothetical protein